jgi:hypothetical protein
LSPLGIGLPFAGPAHADIVGVASVIDPTPSRSTAIASGFMKSMRQRAARRAGTRRAGPGAAAQRATLALQDLIGRPTGTCDERDVNHYGRIVGRCLVADLDINEWLVMEGLALAYRRYSHDYVAAEDEAQAARRGMWVGTFEPPWEWRRRH